MTWYSLAPGATLSVRLARFQQARAIVRLLGKTPLVSQRRLNELLNEAAKSGELPTKQNPWRVFMFYRDELIRSGVLRVTDGDALFELYEGMEKTRSPT